ncbi:MAG: hypothetical protein J5744_07775 [Oscillospiraceae bacterium]|nr:hypothetical protein [Oscillospiraceae bacterium]
MRKRKLAAIAVMIILVSVMLGGCSEYSSHFKAIGMVHSNTPSHAFMSFYQFSGTIVFKLKCRDSSGGTLSYAAKIEEGSIRVYVDSGGSRDLVVSLEPQSSTIEGRVNVPHGRIYVIVESNDVSSNGELEFNIE